MLAEKNISQNWSVYAYSEISVIIAANRNSISENLGESQVISNVTKNREDLQNYAATSIECIV